MEMTSAARGRAIIFTPDLNDNSLGRTYVTWLLLKRLGWECVVAALVSSDDPEPSIWAPLKDSDFATDCRVITYASGSDRRSTVADLINQHQLVVCTKAVHGSLDLISSAVRRSGRRLVLDYDDPDVDLYRPYKGNLARLPLRYGRHPISSMRGLRCWADWRRLSGAVELVVSNPVLQSMHGGTIIPHVREPGSVGAEHSSFTPTVAFIGSPRPHKGIAELRQAASDVGFQLLVTANAPADARATETWLGSLPYETAMDVLRNADIIAVPSHDSVYARAQLPAKLMDGMLAGRCVVASDLPPMTWALNDTGLIFSAGSYEGLRAALQKASDPAVRQRLGRLSRERALNMFTVGALEQTAEKVYGRPAGD